MSKLLDEKREALKIIEAKSELLNTQMWAINSKRVSPFLDIHITEHGLSISGSGRENEARQGQGNLFLSDDYAIKLCQALKEIYEL